MQFVYGLIVGLIVAAVVAFVLYRAVIVAKLKAAATQAEQAARSEVSHVGAAVSGGVGKLAADVQKKL